MSSPARSVGVDTRRVTSSHLSRFPSARSGAHRRTEHTIGLSHEDDDVVSIIGGVHLGRAGASGSVEIRPGRTLSLSTWQVGLR